MSSSFSMTGLDVGALRAGFESRVSAHVDEVIGEVAHLGNDLVERMQSMILAAHTPTGRARVASSSESDHYGPLGAQAGRYVTGEFYEGVDSAVAVERAGRGSLTAGGNLVVAAEVILTWGWLENWRDYFEDQEWGTDTIEAVGALGDSFTLALTRVPELLERVAR
ncbi:hypothetical protein BKA24_001811 [Microbacterium marinum]|uniref:Uncharacterized protein n=1 Tax=Microbacterium marinum TaxID=421115 RepID=A0A7W7FII0_9MICO|nr:hypothetical protein [Microbacterium marinum]MBB4667102.1 hypothetical protein [Microbacterium marinum]